MNLFKSETYTATLSREELLGLVCSHGDLDPSGYEIIYVNVGEGTLCANPPIEIKFSKSVDNPKEGVVS